MKYSLILLVSAASLISVNGGKLPSYIHVCKQNDPTISKCIKKSIENLKPNLAAGLPELGVPPLDPMLLGDVSLDLGPGFKVEAYGVNLTGGTNFTIEDLVADIEADIYSFDVAMPKIVATGTYEMDATIVGIPLEGKGPLHITATSIRGRGKLHGKKVMRQGKNYMTFKSMELAVNIGGSVIRLGNLFNGDPTLGEVTNELLKEHSTEILASMIPELERIMIKYYLHFANKIVTISPWEELLPLA